MAWHKNLHKWLGTHIVNKTIRRRTDKEIEHILLCIADHFEPYNGNVSDEAAINRVRRWVNCLPQVVSDILDVDGEPYRHTFFYPSEQYRPDILHEINDLCSKGLGEVEIHIHHDQSDSLSFRKEMLEFKNTLFSRHGMLSRLKGTDEVLYGFVHGDWALDNSRPDGRKCGVNDELIILKETGCYADFTLPSAPDITQINKINSIYYAKDDPDKPCSHNDGKDVTVGMEPSGDLLLIQGPLTLDWSKRKYGIFPGIENGEIGGNRAPTFHRFMLWMNQRIAVVGRPEWVFIKIHCHGAKEGNADVLLSNQMRSFLNRTLKELKEIGINLHFVTSREMYNIVKAAEAGKSGNPGEYRDFILEPVS